MRNLIKNILSFFDKQIVRKSSYEKLISNTSRFKDYEFLEIIDKTFFKEVYENLKFSKSQL